MADRTPINSGSSTASDNCIACQYLGSNVNATGTGGINANDMFVQSLVEVNSLKKEIEELKKGQRKTDNFYSSSARMNNTIRVVVIVLMIIPVIQLIACAGVIYYLGIQESIASLLNWILSGISLVSFIELGVGGLKLYAIEKKLEELEKKCDSIKE